MVWVGNGSNGMNISRFWELSDYGSSYYTHDIYLADWQWRSLSTLSTIVVLAVSGCKVRTTERRVINMTWYNGSIIVYQIYRIRVWSYSTNRSNCIFRRLESCRGGLAERNNHINSISASPVSKTSGEWDRDCVLKINVRPAQTHVALNTKWLPSDHQRPHKCGYQSNPCTFGIALTPLWGQSLFKIHVTI